MKWNNNTKITEAQVFAYESEELALWDVFAQAPLFILMYDKYNSLFKYHKEKGDETVLLDTTAVSDTS